MPPDDFESIVSAYYDPLYRFACSLTRTEADAGDLTQQTFYLWANKGHQLRNRGKVKSWLFTTLRREFLDLRRKAARFPHFELSASEPDLPVIAPPINTLDSACIIELLGQLNESYQAVLTLFYLEDHSYREIGEILGVPTGTVQSRIYRGMAQLERLIQNRETAPAGL